MSTTMSNASVNYRSMSSNSADFKTRSKSLVDDKNSGNISIDNDPLNFTTSSYTTTLDIDKK
jgi:hypothetical protein